jgi:hypothetical protein
MSRSNECGSYTDHLVGGHVGAIRTMWEPYRNTGSYTDHLMVVETNRELYGPSSGRTRGGAVQTIWELYRNTGSYTDHLVGGHVGAIRII